MSFAVYGHTNTIVFTYTKNGKFHKETVLGGAKMIHYSLATSIKESKYSVSLGANIVSANSDEYCRDYYGLEKYTAPASGGRNKQYYGISKYLGYEDGTTPGDIFSATLYDTNAPAKCLFVWDEGCGGLELPLGCNTVYWTSDKALPDKEQFEKIAHNCFLSLDANVLRNAGAMISKKISWERTASELIAEIQSNPEINYLLKASRLFITFGLDGAVFIVPKNKSGQLEAALILTHGEVEGAVSARLPNSLNNAFIYYVFASSLAVNAMAMMSHLGLDTLPESGNIFDKFIDLLGDELAVGGDDGTLIDLKQAESEAVKWGNVLRSLLEITTSLYCNLDLIKVTESIAENENEYDASDTLKAWPAFAIPLNPTPNGDVYKVPDDWTVINSLSKKISDIENKTIAEIENLTISELVGKQLSDVAFEYVQNGAVAIEGLPHFSLGAFTTVDRWEIEAYQNISNLIMGYANGESTRPLSIAVFGSPGSGKSFGVTQIAQNMLPGKIEKLEFNVSQFTSLSDLGVAFQKVRDTILHGKLPLVFFDEFDSDKDGLPLGWVKSFLMPMQDGKFRDDSGEHPLGRCILVFAGGTAATFEEFIAPMDNDGNGVAYDPIVIKELENAKLQFQAFKNIKGPDFISRLRGTINVLGPNPKNDKDKNYILRRALLLRSLCERNFKFENIAPVSKNIIHAMLNVPEYKHGARSMEAILDMSRINGNSWEPVSLPSHSQLSLHVDADAFIKLVLSN